MFGLGTAVFFAASSLLSSRAVKIISSWSVVAWSMLVGLVVTTPFVIASGVPAALSGANIAWLVASGVGNVTGLVFSALAFRVGKVGVVTPILATEGALAAVISALLGESIAPIIAFLLLVIVCGVVLVALGPGRGVLSAVDATAARQAALLGLGAGVVFGAVFYASGETASLGALWAVAAVRAGGVALVSLPVLARGGHAIPRAMWPWLAGGGLIDTVGYMLVVAGTANGVAITSVLASQYAVVSVTGGIVLFRERVVPRQLIGIALTISGVAALAVVRAV